ncbi:Succinylglutamate desuccinylase/aspartoacylase [Janibacter sp. HTCC2649]|uniref:succinylglutamate desuccinylase/aspartoacylase family protein n=1 Tax=Janibacter sp. HTCC2649 TaxID=313589 RepID=UPI0000670EA3|nr:succinylglutamate desuccinylase/aspartoacylase family protein [Janibacter sp. HTCC2649]EAP97519.1 Succinylglutamate desuccinylase/aspartoacylase [Janibacter sp. HTCC2649]
MSSEPQDGPAEKDGPAAKPGRTAAPVRKTKPTRTSFAIGSVKVRPGHTREIGLPITKLVTGSEISLPVRVVHGRHDGPVVWINAAIHGDEVVGVEVIRRVLATLSPKTFRGTLLAVPIVNVHGFMAGDRYLPDRRDLNRSFPGSPRGSLAGRIANLMMREVVDKCEVGIDLHTGSDRRTNLPQIRADLDDPRTRALAEAFGAPVMLHAKLRDGSLRAAAREGGATVLLFESGEAMRFDQWAIEAGVAGVLRVLAALDMIDATVTTSAAATAAAAVSSGAGDLALPAPPPGLVSRRSSWVRARRTGIVHLDATLGQRVEVGDRLGGLSNSFGRTLRLVKAERAGVIIGRTTAPLVNRGDALVHIAEIEGAEPPGIPDSPAASDGFNALDQIQVL